MPAIDIDRDTAHAAAQRELAKPIYPRRSPSQQFIGFVEDLLHQIVNRAASVPGGWFTISLLLLGVAVAVVTAFRAARRTLRAGRAAHSLFGPAELTAAEHRAAAEQFAASDDWAAAIRHRLRAVARTLEDIGIVNPVPGRTANELAGDAAIALPQLAVQFEHTATTFNDVSYGELPATANGYRSIVDLDDQLGAVVNRPLPR